MGGYIKMAITSSFNKSSKYPVKPLSSRVPNKEAPQEEIMEKFMRQVNIINKSFGKGDVNE